ncbi:MAG: response regulator transcription factor [Verrucomicrobiae bacterium]|nr:response regulator transcription factor [Verrucomicrobiae bacterium]
MSESAKKRVLVVDDHPLLREGISSLLQSAGYLDVCAQAGTASEAATVIENERPDLVVTDLSLPDRNGLELIRDTLARYPQVLFLVVSMHDETLYAERVLRAGAKGFIMKDAASDELVDAIEKVLAGEIYVSPKMASLLLRRLTGKSEPSMDQHSILRELTDRELQVFELVGRALSNQAIAEKLNISARTVDAHKTRIKEKLALPDNNAMLRFAVKWLEG